MKFCNRLLHSMSVEYDCIIPCCAAFAPTVPTFPLGKDKPFRLDDYLAFLSDVVADINSDTPTMCKGCVYLEEVESLPEMTLSLHLFQLNKHRFLCNCKCIYCDFWKTPKASPNELLPTVKALDSLGLLHKDCRIDWAGGEPTIHKEFIPITRYLQERGYHVRFFTNAIHYAPIISDMMREGLGSVESSLDSGFRDTFTAIKGKDKFEKVIANLTQYSDANASALSLKYIICRQNCSKAEIDSFLSICRTLNVGNIYVSLRLPVMKNTEACYYQAAAYLFLRAEEMGLRCHPEIISPSHMRVITKCKTHLLLDSPPLLAAGGAGKSLFWGETTKAENVTFDIGSEEEYSKSLVKAAGLVSDFSLREWPGGMFFSGSPADPLSSPDYTLRAEMVRLRSILSEAEWNSLPLPLENPAELFWRTLAYKHREAIKKYAGALRGREVYFWGYDNAYLKYKDLFIESHPKAIIVNREHDGSPPEYVDGLPVFFAQDLLSKEKVLPIVIFAQDAYIKWVVHFIETKFPSFGGDNLILCRLFL